MLFAAPSRCGPESKIDVVQEPTHKSFTHHCRVPIASSRAVQKEVKRASRPAFTIPTQSCNKIATPSLICTFLDTSFKAPGTCTVLRYST